MADTKAEETPAREWKIAVSVIEAKGIYSLSSESPAEGDPPSVTSKVSVKLLDLARTSSTSEPITAKGLVEEKKEGKAEDQAQTEMPEENASPKPTPIFQQKFEFEASHSLGLTERTSFLDDIHSEAVQISVTEDVGGEEQALGTVSLSIQDLVTKSEIEGWYPIVLSAAAKTVYEAIQPAPNTTKIPPSVFVRVNTNEPLLNTAEANSSNVLTVESTGIFNLPEAWNAPAPEGSLRDYSIKYGVPFGRGGHCSATKIKAQVSNGDEETFEVVDEKTAPKEVPPSIELNHKRCFYLSAGSIRTLKALDYLNFIVTGKETKDGENTWNHKGTAKICLRQLLYPGATTLTQDLPVQAPSTKDADGKESNPLAVGEAYVTIKLALAKPLIQKRKPLTVSEVLPTQITNPPPVKRQHDDSGVFKAKIDEISAEAGSCSTGTARQIRANPTYQRLKHQTRRAVIGEIQRQFRWRRDQDTSIAAEAAESTRHVPANETKAVVGAIKTLVTSAIGEEVLPDPEGDMHAKIQSLRQWAREAEANGDLHIAHAHYLSRISALSDCTALHDEDLNELTALCWYDYGAFICRGSGSTLFQTLAYASDTKGGSRNPTGDIDRAKDCFRRALKYDPQCVPALLGIGTLLCEQDEPETALEPLRTAAKILRHPIVFAMLSLAMDMLEDDRRMDKYAKIALKALDMPIDKKKLKTKAIPTALNFADWNLHATESEAKTADGKLRLSVYLIRYLLHLHTTRLPLTSVAKYWPEYSPSASVERVRQLNPYLTYPNAKETSATVLMWVQAAKVWRNSTKTKTKSLPLLKHIVGNVVPLAEPLRATDDPIANRAVGEAYAFLGFMQLEAGDVKDATASLQTSLKRLPSDRSRKALTICYLRGGQYEKAKSLLESEPLQPHPKSAYKLAWLAYSLLHLNQTIDSDHALADATRIDRRCPLVWAVATLVAATEGQRTEASDAMQAAFESEICGLGWLLEEIGSVCSEKGWPDLAKRVLKRASLTSELSPESQQVLKSS